MFRIVLILCVLFYYSLSMVSAEESSSQKVVTLKECIAETLTKSPLVTYSVSDIEEKQQALEATKLNRLPFASFQYGHTFQPDASTSDHYFYYSFTIEQPVYTGRSITTAIEIGGLNVMYSNSSYRKTKNDIVYKVHQAYFDFLRAKKFEDIAQQSLLQLQSHFKDANAFFEAGLIPKNDLLLSDLQLAQGGQDLLKAQNSVQLSQAALNLLMKKPVDSTLLIQDVPDFIPRLTTWNELVAKANTERAEISQAEIAVQLAEKNITAVKSAYLPTVAVSASYMRQGDHPLAESYQFGASEVKTMEATARWRFWTWRQNRYKEEEAIRSMSKARDLRENLIDSILLELRQAFLTMQQSEKNIALSRQAIEQAKENYRISEARYLAQLSTSTEVLDANTLLLRSQTNYYNALYEYNLAWAAIDRATGTLADY